MRGIFRGSLIAVWLIGLSACATKAPDKTALDVPPAPAAEQTQQSAEAAPVVEAEPANKAKTEQVAVVAETAKTQKMPEKKPVPDPVQKTADNQNIAAKQKAANGAAQKTAEQQKVAGATPASGARNGEIRARHILVATRQEAEKIITRLQGGANFGAIARESSIDPTARDNSGELGFFRRGMMVPEFEQAAYALPVGQFSREPVQTQFGWHVILVEEVR